MQYFSRKAEALNCLAASSDELRLFMEDINTNSSKRFIVARAEEIYKLLNNFSQREKPKFGHIYEGWTTKQPMNFAVDLDISNPKYRKCVDETISTVINIVNEMASKHYNHTFKPSDIMVLRTEPQEKKDSVHIIFKGVTFENYYACKHFFSLILAEYPKVKEYGWDDAIYRPTCFRTAFSTKMGKTFPLLPYRVKINNVSTLMPRNFETEMDYWLTSLLTYIEPNCPYIKAPPKEKVETEVGVKDNDINTPLDELREMLDELPMVYCDEYDNWIKVGMALHHEYTKTNNKQYFELWDKWSSKSSKYTNTKDLKKTWNAFKPSSTPITLASIRHWWSEIQDPDRPKIKLGLEYIINGYEPKPILLNHNNEYKSITVNKPKLEPEDFMPYLHYKLLAVQSEKGTGKTFNLLRALFEHGHAPNKILFVSPRRTFGMKLKADLQHYDFRLYSEIKESQIDVARIICQLDSIHRIKTLEFDLIVIDECESLARYVTSSHFTKNPNSSLTLANLRYLLNGCKQTVILDADLSERSMKYFGEMVFENVREQMQHEDEPITNIIYESKKAKTRKKDVEYGCDSDDDKPIMVKTKQTSKPTIIKPEDNTFVIINQFLLYQDYKVKYTDLRTWYCQLCTDLDKNRKLVIPMASREKAKDLYEYLITKYDDKQIKIINSETSDQDKLQQLMNINEEWTTYDVVIYTPSICMGVSFDVPNHFDRIYAYGCHNSLGAQEFAQMLHRVRNPKDKRIIMTLDKFMPYSQQNDTVDYTQAEEMLCNDYYLTTYELNNNLIPKKYGRDRKIEYPEQYKKEPIYELYVRNTQEMLQDRLNFGASLFGYLRTKGYMISKLNYTKELNPTIMQEIKNIHTIRKTTEKQELVQHIVNARDITVDEYDNKKKFKDEVMTEQDIYELKRYNFKRIYQITSERMDETIVDTYVDPDKMRWYSNLTSIIDHAEQTTSDKLRIMQHNENYLASKRESCFDAFTFNGHYSQHYYVIKIYESLGFNINQMDTKVYNNDFAERLSKLVEWLDKEKMNLMMKYGLKTKPGSLLKMSPQQQLRFINSISEYQYGIVIKKMNYYPKDRSKEYYKLTDKNVWDDLPHDGENNNPKLVPIKIIEYEGAYINADPFIDDAE